MVVATVVPDLDCPPDWQRLLLAILEPLGVIRAIDRLPEGVAGFPCGEPVIVVGAAIPLQVAAARHDTLILAPSPFDDIPKVFPAPADGVRVLSFTSACHAAAQRAGLRSTWFQYFPDPGRLLSAADGALPFSNDRPPPIEPFSLDSLRRMACGNCVCCTESALARDYIVDGVNGLLGDSASRWTPEMARVVGFAARLSVRQGFDRWRKDQGRLAECVFTPRAPTRTWLWTHGLPRSGHRPRRTVAPAVTVATVVRNGASQLRDTLPSILGQTCMDMELVVFDGGSTDGTLDVIQEHAAQIHHWTSAPDAGPYDAMQKAAAVARGRRILFMNAGDRFVDEDALGRLVEAARDDADVVAGHHIYIDAHGIESVNHCVDFEKTYCRLLAGELDSAWIRGVPCHQAVLTRTELIRRHGFDLSYRITADHEFMYRMRRQGASFQVVPTIVAEYVGGGLSARQEFRCLEEWRRIAHAYSRDRRRADRSLDRLIFMAMKALRRRGPFDFSAEPARSRPLLAARIDVAHRLKSAFRRRLRR
jgi:glycosyltransferase involved in cell wall biosynthesis